MEGVGGATEHLEEKAGASDKNKDRMGEDCEPDGSGGVFHGS